MFSDVKTFKRNYEGKISSMFAKSLEGASLLDKYAALASMIRDEINQRWIATNDTYLSKGEREVYYFSLEFLVGKFLENNLLYLNAQDVCRQGLN